MSIFNFSFKMELLLLDRQVLFLNESGHKTAYLRKLFLLINNLHEFYGSIIKLWLITDRASVGALRLGQD